MNTGLPYKCHICGFETIDFRCFEKHCEIHKIHKKYSCSDNFKKALTIKERIAAMEKQVAYCMTQVELLVNAQIDNLVDYTERRERIKQCQELLDAVRTIK